MTFCKHSDEHCYHDTLDFNNSDIIVNLQTLLTKL